MPAKDKRYYLCTGKAVLYKDLYLHANDHIIGETRRILDEGDTVIALALYETPVSAGQVPPIDPEIMLYQIGDARRIKCRYKDCTHRVRWEIGEKAKNALIRRHIETDEYLERQREVVQRTDV